MYKNISKPVVKMCCENDFSHTILVAKVKVEFNINGSKVILTSISVDIKFNQPSKVLFTSALRPR